MPPRAWNNKVLRMKDLYATFSKEIKDVKDKIVQHENRLTEVETRINQLNNRVDNVIADVKTNLK